MKTEVERIAELEAFVCDVIRIHTFTILGRDEAHDVELRTPLGNKAALLMGIAPLPTEMEHA